MGSRAWAYALVAADVLGDDLISGRALPLLFDLLYSPLGDPGTVQTGGITAGFIALGACLYVAVYNLAWTPPGAPLPLIHSMGVCWMSASLFFRLVHALDHDTGVCVCVAPFLGLVCMQWGEVNQYRSYVRSVLACVTLVLLIYVGVGTVAGRDEGTTRSYPAHVPALSALWVVLDAAFATSHANPWVVLGRTLLYAILALVGRAFVSVLLQNPGHNWGHLFLYGLLLLLTCDLQSSETRATLLRLKASKPTRVNLLLCALTTAAAVEFQWPSARHRLASYKGALILVVGRLLNAFTDK